MDGYVTLLASAIISVSLSIGVVFPLTIDTDLVRLLRDRERMTKGRILCATCSIPAVALPRSSPGESWSAFRPQFDMSAFSA